MRLRRLTVGCFGGGTGLPSLLGGLKRNPWVRLNAVVTTFDSGGSSGQLRDALGVLPPGDVLKCALALARNEREARRILLTRFPALENSRLGGHTGGNLLLSMMEQQSSGFLEAVDGLSAMLACLGHVWPASTESASLCAEYSDGSTTRGEVEVDAGQASGRWIEHLWLDPPPTLHPRVADVIRSFDAVVIGPGSFFTSLVPIFLTRGMREALAEVEGPFILVTNLLTEGRGMRGFTAGEAARRMAEYIGRDIDAVIVNDGRPPQDVIERYADEHKEPLLAGELPPGCELVLGDFWSSGIARHHRRRLGHAVWAVLAERLLD